ncbi:MAG: heme-binding protein [Betaproteobacteria bacterium]|nr:heme-binding protein [Betaproteobacteria bacterium]
MQTLDLERAQQLVAHAMQKATEDFGRPICVAVCDDKGFLLAFARMPGSPVRSVQIAQGKAYSSARMGVTTQAFLERLHKEKIEAAYFCDPLLTALPGGSPLKTADGTLVGAVGVSGLKSEEDQAVTDFVASRLATLAG